jgi:hypothetical protein
MEEKTQEERVKKVVEIEGDIWEQFYNGIPVAIPTNCNRDRFGFNVMGKGLAKDAKELFPKLPQLIGKAIKDNRGSNGVFLFHLPTSKVDDKGKMQYNFLFTFPTKQNWWDKESSLKLIENSATRLVETVNAIGSRLGIEKVILPRVGCGLGKRNWENDIRPILAKILDERFPVINKIVEDDAY